MNVSKGNATASYAAVQGVYWMSFCIIFTFSSVYLLDRGFSNTEIGLLIGISGMISAVLQPLAGDLADRSRRCSLRGLIIALGGVMLLASLGVLMAASSPLLTLLLYGILVVLLQVLTPLVYSLGMSCINRGIPLNFGVARGIGSLAFAVISYAAGLLVAAAGTRVIPCLIAVLYGLLIVAVLRFGYDKEKNEAVSKAEAQTRGTEKTENSGFFRRYRRFWLLLVGGILAFTSHNMINNFAFQIVETKGGGSEAMGTVIALAAVYELPVMFLFGWMVKKVKSGTWLIISGLFFTLKAVATLLVTNIVGMYLIQGFQMFGFALFVVASVYYVNSIMEEKDRVKGQAYMTMTNTLGSVLGSLFGGVLIDAMGIPAMLLVSSVAAAAGMVTMAVAAEKGRRGN